jgi:hypothetical protein
MFILFSVVPTDCSDGRPSDTEELLGRHDYSAANEKDVCEDKQQQQPNNAKNSAPSSEKRQLNFEVSFVNQTDRAVGQRSVLD